MQRRGFIQSIITGAAVATAAGLPVYASEDRPHITLWQLPPQTKTQMNSYVMRTQAGTVVVIDGGCEGDAPYLRGFIGALGNHIHSWFISHPHSDHVDALTAILKSPAGIRIDAIYGSLPEESWVEKNNDGALATLQALNAALKTAGKTIIEQNAGDSYTIDGVLFEVLAVKNPEITANAINNQSVVMRVDDGSKSILFLGDLGAEAGEKLMNTPFRNKLRADYVQMAHHGQRGVNEEFYHVTTPRFCLWPTPDWLWENDNGGGRNSGSWETLKVREWMSKLNIECHYVSADGLYKID